MNLDVINSIIEQQRQERRHIGEKLMKQLWESFPMGLEVDLGNEQKATLVPVGEPELSENGDWQFISDWKLDNCDQDHIEICVRISGGGGAVA